VYSVGAAAWDTTVAAGLRNDARTKQVIPAIVNNFFAFIEAPFCMLCMK
jgi:hypothetical protein